MAVPARVSVVALQVADLDRSTAFYQALGWPKSAASREGIAFFNTAGGLLALYDASLPAALGVELPGGRADGFRGVVLSIHTASTEEVDEALRLAEAAGATAVKPAEATAAGVYAGLFGDPDGHVWEAGWNPSYALAADGRYLPP